MTPTAVSLFAGVEGIGLALERAGFKVVAAVEIDNAARGVINDRCPETTLFTDVTKVTADELLAARFDPRTGVLTAGFPCQDLSVAGARRGMADGTRSGLYWHVVRLLAELRPRWVILENVPGLLSAVCPCTGDGICGDTDCPGELHTVDGGACGPGRCMVEHGGAMGAVLGSLGELGYGFAYRVLDAQHFGVPQRRRRVVVVGCLGDDRRPVEVLLEPEGGGGNHPPRQPEGTRVAATLTAGSHRPGVSAPGRHHEDDTNLVVANALTAREGKGPDSDATTTLVVNAPTANGVGTCGADNNRGQAGHLVPMTFQKVIRPATSDHPDVWEDRDVAATLSPYDLGSETRAVELVVSVLGDHTHALTSEGADASEDGTGRGTPIIAFDPKAGGDQSFSGAFEVGTGITPAMQGSSAPAVAYDMQNDSVGELAPTLSAAGPRSHRGAGLLTETTVRRLTPVECERLQGFPDGHTATSWGKPQADSARYRQMGNAVAVPVFTWVARRIRAIDHDHLTSLIEENA